MRSIALAACLAGAIHGQTPPIQRFDVASIKPTPPGTPPGSAGNHSGQGRLTMNNATLKRCIQGAFNVGPNQIQGGPDWLDVDHFEIVAKAEEPVGDSTLMAMLQTLLAERFKLTWHRETKSIEAFALEVAKNGPKLEKAEPGGTATSTSPGHIEVKSADMNRFATALARRTDAPVVNMTGLEGIFNIKLDWNPEADKPLRPGPDGAIPADRGVSLFTAIQQQLGLRLMPRKVPIEIIVVDHAEKPTEN